MCLWRSGLEETIRIRPSENVWFYQMLTVKLQSYVIKYKRFVIIFDCGFMGTVCHLSQPDIFYFYLFLFVYCLIFNIVITYSEHNVHSSFTDRLQTCNHSTVFRSDTEVKVTLLIFYTWLACFMCYLEGDLVLFSSPDLQTRVISSQLPEPLPVHSEQPSCHHRWPAGHTTQTIRDIKWESRVVVQLSTASHCLRRVWVHSRSTPCVCMSLHVFSIAGRLHTAKTN